MRRYLAKRVGTAVFVIYVVVSLSFFMIRLMPGNGMQFLEAQLQRQGGYTPQQIEQQVAAIYAVTPNAPILQQYLQYLGNAVTGDFGNSYTHPGESVIHIIASALPWTIFSVGIALLVSFVIGIAIGTVMAATQATGFSKVLTLVISFLSAVPNYLIAILLIYFLTDIHPLFPQGGAYSADVQPGLNAAFVGSIFSHAILPILAYVIVGFGGWALQMKGSAISTLGTEYVRAAEIRGLGRRRVLRSYVGRNSMLPQVTLLALSLGFMFGGSVFIEQLFNYPGIGYYLVTAVNSRDYSVMMGCFVLITLSVVVSNLVVDLIYPLVDPRIVRPTAQRKTATTDAEPPAVTVPSGGEMV